ncbi:MAG: hypothetical protein PHQ71_06955 [Candidatus Hydrothermia bacterium]|nr:hypothetical protein [Candidatus Hydrothermia bacterium]
MNQEPQLQVQKTHRLIWNKWWFWVFVIFIIIPVIFGLSGKEEETMPETITPAQEELEIPKEVALPAVGEIVGSYQQEDSTPKEQVQTISPTQQQTDQILEEIIEPPKLEEDSAPAQEFEAIPTMQQQMEYEPVVQQSGPEEPSVGGKWYTSSYHTAQYYYHESCQGWQGLSERYLKVFDNEAELLSRYNRKLHPDCSPY